MNGYTCMYCNKFWPYDDPGFVYWRVDSRGRNLDGRDGRVRSGIGWFAHCADKAECDRRKRNIRAGVAAEQLELAAA